MATRFEIERAVLVSGLDAGCRHLVHVLCIRIDAETNTILDAYQPSLTDLAKDTARHRRTIQRYLNLLERAGWITRKRPLPHLARREHARTAYQIHMPAARDTLPPGARDITPWPGDTTPPGLGTGSAEARGTAPPRSSGSSGSSDEVVAKAIWAKTGVTVSAEWAARVREQILGARDNVRHPAAYIRRVIADAPAHTYLPPRPTPTPPPAPRTTRAPVHISDVPPDQRRRRIELPRKDTHGPENQAQPAAGDQP